MFLKTEALDKFKKRNGIKPNFVMKHDKEAEEAVRSMITVNEEGKRGIVVWWDVIQQLQQDVTLHNEAD